MKKQSLAIVGLGRLGQSCARAIQEEEDTTLAGAVSRRIEPPAWLDAPLVGHISELAGIDAVLVCVPPDAVCGVAQDLLQRRLRVVECARLHGEDFLRHKAALHRAALHHAAAAVVGAGFDPGLLSMFRSQFAMAIPHGHTTSRLHTAAGLHHTLAADAVKGVRKALALEQTARDGTRQRYVYVELDPHADPAQVESAIRRDPCYLDAQTLVFPVDSVAALEETNRGVLLERHAAARERRHAALLLEARCDEAALAARIMLAAARALPFLKAGAYSLLDVPPILLWGERGPAIESEWG